MKTIEFVRKFKELSADENKANLIRNRIKTKYVPYANKMITCENIASATTKTEVGENQYKFNDTSVLRHMLYSLNIVYLYTDIEIDFKNAAVEYDLLEENDLFELIFNAINPNEIERFDAMLEMTMADIYNNERSMVSYQEKRDIVKLDLINSVIEKVYDMVKNNKTLKDKVDEIMTEINAN